MKPLDFPESIIFSELRFRRGLKAGNSGHVIDPPLLSGSSPDGSFLDDYWKML
jgi:hypothetical protein